MIADSSFFGILCLTAEGNEQIVLNVFDYTRTSVLDRRPQLARLFVETYCGQNASVLLIKLNGVFEQVEQDLRVDLLLNQK